MIIAISGFGGSGKSTYAQKVSMELGAPVISIDSFCINRGIQDYDYWNIFDFNRFKEQILIPFSEGYKILTYDVFDWEQNKIINKTTVTFKDSIIVEGVGLFRPDLLKYFTQKIWMDVSIEDSILSGKNRDKNEYGLPENSEWDGIWKRNDIQCFESYKPLLIADKIITR